MDAPARSRRKNRNRDSVLIQGCENKDFISDLPDDILHLIFTKFDYGDLAKLSRVSRKMAHFANFAKQRRTKERIPIMMITQACPFLQNRADNGDFFIDAMRRKGRNFYMIVKARSHEVFKRRYAPDNVPKRVEEYKMEQNNEHKIAVKRQPIPKQIYDGIFYLLNRFICEIIVFESILFDDAFMFTIDSFPLSESQLRFYKTTLVKNNQLQTKNFLMWLVSLDVKGFTLDDSSCKIDLRSNPDWILELLATASPNTKLRIKSAFSHNINYPNSAPIELISKFSSFDISMIIFEASTVVEVIKQRFREKKEGNLMMRQKRGVYLNELASKLRGTLEVQTNNPSLVELRTSDSIFAAHMRMSGNVLQIYKRLFPPNKTFQEC